MLLSVLPSLAESRHLLPPQELVYQHICHAFKSHPTPYLLRRTHILVLTCNSWTIQVLEMFAIREILFLRMGAPCGELPLVRYTSCPF